MEIIRTPGVTRGQEYAKREEHIPKTYWLLTLGCYKILFQKGGPDNNFMDLFLIGIEIASIILLNHGKVDLENMKFLSKAKDQSNLWLSIQATPHMATIRCDVYSWTT